MKVIGRKIYIGWGANTVIAIEKHCIPPCSIGLTHKLDENNHLKYVKPHVKLVELVEFNGQVLERQLDQPYEPTPNGSEFNNYMTNQGNWLTQEEFDEFEKIKRNKEDILLGVKEK